MNDDMPYPDEVEPYVQAILSQSKRAAIQPGLNAIDALARCDPTPIEEDAVVGLVADNTPLTKTALRDELESIKNEAQADKFDIESVTVIQPESAEEPAEMRVTGWVGDVVFGWRKEYGSLRFGRTDARDAVSAWADAHNVDVDLPDSSGGWKDMTDRWIDQARDKGTFSVVTEAPERPEHSVVESVKHTIKNSGATSDYETWETYRDQGYRLYAPDDGVVYLDFDTISTAASRVDNAIEQAVMSILVGRGLARRHAFEPGGSDEHFPRDHHSRVVEFDADALTEAGLFYPENVDAGADML
jgi:hypothetical protein